MRVVLGWGLLAGLAVVAACGSSTIDDGKGTGSNGLVRCTGTATACFALSAEQCAASQGCASGTCGGTPAACSSMSTKVACTLQEGCEWDDSKSACGGAPAPCATFATDATCPGQSGCAWSDGCSGRPASCEALADSACLQQPGCRLVDAGDAGSTPVNPPDAGIAQNDSGIDCSHPAPVDEIIDDMEDQTPGLSSSSDYASWYTYHDTTPGGHMTPEANAPFKMERIPGGRCASEYAMRASGSGFDDWGAGVGFDFGYGPQFPDGGTSIISVDGTPYDGIRFWARTGQGTSARIEAQLGTVDTKPEGGRCIKLVVPEGGVSSDGAASEAGAIVGGGAEADGGAVAEAAASDDAAASDAAGDDAFPADDGSTNEAASGMADAASAGDAGNGDGAPGAGAVYSTADCYNHYRKAITLTPDWVEYKIRFSDMHQDPGYGYIAPFAIDQIYSFALAVPPGVTFDVWIDDLAWWRTTDP